MDRSKFSIIDSRFKLSNIVLFIVLILLANLKVTNVNATKQKLQGKITVETTITNDGDTDADGFYIGHYIQNEKRITNETSKPDTIWHPVIYGDRMVWGDLTSGIYMYDLSTGLETQISNNKGGYPVIYGDRIVYSGIYMYDLSTGLETQISNNGCCPAIYDDRIVWEEGQNGIQYIYMYGISTGLKTQISPNPANQCNPAIYGDRIIWEDYRNDNVYHRDPDIFLKDLSTGLESKITTNPNYANFIPSSIYSDCVVWADDRKSNSPIYMKDLSTGLETQITTNPSCQCYNPVIYGDRIVWEDIRNGEYSIYMKDLSTGLETQISPNPSNKFNLAIYGDRIVWEDSRNSDQYYRIDIYMTDGMIVLPEYVYVAGLAAGVSKTVQTNVTLPSNIENDVNYYIGSIVDAAGMVVESDDSDNAKLDPNCLTFKNMMPPLHKRPLNVPDVDLVISNLYNPPSAENGSFILMPNTMKNNGLKESGSFIVKFYISSNTNNTISSGDEYLGERTVWALYGKSSNIAYTELMIPATINTGTYYLKAVADASNNVVESNELNNIKTSTLPITITANTTPPQVIISDPSNRAVNVPINKLIKITFNEPIQEGSSYGDIVLKGDNITIPAWYRIKGNILNIESGYLSNGVKYTLTLPANSIEDLAGNPLPQTYTTTFKTSP